MSEPLPSAEKDACRGECGDYADHRAHEDATPCGAPQPYAGRPCNRPAEHDPREGHASADGRAWLARVTPPVGGGA